jgi:CHAT domain-containing protein/Tfp pilus assembly protein PilF
MDEQLAAYLELIQSLLACKQGEESSIYEKYRQLIDTKLVAIMGQYVDLLESKGGSNNAPWLRQEAENIGAKMVPWQELNRRVMKLYRQGEIAQAVPIAERARDIARQIFPSPNNDLAASLNNLAELYESQGRWAEAEPYYDQALAICRELFGDRPNNALAASLNNLAGLYESQGRWAEAEPYYDQALAICRELFGDRPNNDLASSLNNLAGLYRSQGRWAEAEPYYDQALAICRELFGDRPNNNLASSLNNLAGLYRSQGRWAEAEPYYDEALAICRELFGDRPNNDLATSLNNLAGLHIATQRYPAALELFRESTQVQNQILNNYFAHATAKNQLTLLDSMHKNLEAFASFVINHQSNNPVAVEALLDAILQRKAASTIASTILNQNQYTDRYPELRDDFDRWEQLKIQVANTPDPVIRDRLEAQCQKIYQSLSSRIPEIKISLKIDRQAIAIHLPALAQLVEFFRFKEFNFHKSGKDDPAWKPARYLAFILTENPDLPVRLIDLGLAAPIDLAINNYRAVFEQDRNSMAIGSSKSRLPKLEQPVDPKINAELTAGCALRAAILDPILQHTTHANTLIFAADSELYRVPFATLPLDESGTRLIDKYRVETLTAARDLRRRYETIVGVASRSENRPSGIPIIVGDPDYNYGSSASLPIFPHPDKPLETIMGGDNFDRMPITKALTTQIANQLNVTPYLDTQATSHIFQQRSPKILVVATHGFAKNIHHVEQRKAWQDLAKCSSAEDERIIAKYGDAIDLDFRAQAQQMLDDNPDGEYAEWFRDLLIKIDNHLATHQPSRQITKEADPMRRCGIAITGANHWWQNHPLAPEAGNGVLLAHDIAQLNLWGTELAVIIACSTALGDTSSGQGIFGLRRAFAISGAKHTIVSLWDVPVDASILLMERFFELYQTGVPPADALRQAQNYIRTISISELATTKLGKEALDGKEGLKATGAIDSQTPPDFQPWRSPYYWGAWICQG